MKMAVIYVSSHYVSSHDDDYETITSILPTTAWVDIDPDSEEYRIWTKYVNLKNVGLTKGYYMLIHCYDKQEIECNVTFAKAKELVEKEQKRKNEEARKREKAKEEKARKQKEVEKKQKEAEQKKKEELYLQLKAEFEKSK